ncbi:MAG: hypothetical protein EBS09_02430 [Flavobacteriia bacterium]|nr:hypothetical protein [Flavobacteriia bacterium]NBY41148.1 hypothetical protein [Flavobacteriia bacterium]
MKLLYTSLFGLMLCFQGLSQNQMSKSIAVANPNVNNLSIKSEIAAKMMRLELIKIDKYRVLDEFDMADVIKSNASFSSGCYGLNCLSDIGEGLKVDYVLCGSFDGLGNKIAITLKMVDVKNRTIYQSLVKEFDNQEPEIQRMIEQMVKEMNQIEIDKVTAQRLTFKNEPISSNNVGKINNSGPRIGYAFMVGSLSEFAKRSEEEGGLDIFPGVSMIGYQVEGQYVGTENFSALVECVINASGLEQGKFIPSLTIMNGFRFGKAGWEFAFGPGFSVKSTSQGFFDTDHQTNRGYFSETDWNQYCNENFYNNAAYPEYNVNGVFTPPTPEQFNSNYHFAKHFDVRGQKSINTTFVFAFGRTFRRGALNVPVNAFYSSQKGGGYVGLNIGFNVQKSKKNINSTR